MKVDGGPPVVQRNVRKSTPTHNCRRPPTFFLGGISSLRSSFGGMMKVKVNDNTIATIVQMRGTGHSINEIAKAIDASPSVVQYWLNRLKKWSQARNPDDVLMAVLLRAYAFEKAGRP